ncbi:ACR3 family arsenite efflux pump ArsB [Microbacterium sp. AG1240]|uniref:arsenic resistance protein n=1 Tax=Microbacterium sp. AG1240 TaxID=2183992 RepID=UPI000EAFCF4D|nr:arsenic resistance protein [Microbacterium sp. AG1240]RKT33508.1 ACR3 family arsenite efflux pump ArsB [Microbacterium sp. AG1240]
MAEWAERHQVALYIAAIVAGAAVGLGLPSSGPALEPAITPLLGLLLFATFLGVPFAQVVRGLRDTRMLAVLVGVNFVVVPAVVFGLSRFVADEPALLVGVLLVLLTPCVDYVIVFVGLAGGARDRLLAATPLLMGLQIVLLPLYLWAMTDADVLGAFDVRPFVEAFVFLIVVPLAAAALVQALARRRRPFAAILRAAPTAMIPLMMLALATVVASQVSAVSTSAADLWRVVPIFIAFPLIAASLGVLAARFARLDVPGRRASAFSAATRNSLVVLPLALALPASFALTPLVVVTQTLIELVAMVVMVAVVPRVVRASGPAQPRPSRS